MYATAHRVSSSAGQQGINVFLHQHGSAFPWPVDPSELPEIEPGVPLWDNGPVVKPGVNRVHSYLDVLAPDHTLAHEIEAALTGLWLQLLVEEAGPPAGLHPLPNPVVYRQGGVVLRFGVELGGTEHRAPEMAQLRRAVEPAIARWFAMTPAG